jgi:hypothetical protein
MVIVSMAWLRGFVQFGESFVYLTSGELLIFALSFPVAQFVERGLLAVVAHDELLLVVVRQKFLVADVAF